MIKSVSQEYQLTLATKFGAGRQSPFGIMVSILLFACSGMVFAERGAAFLKPADFPVIGSFNSGSARIDVSTGRMMLDNETITGIFVTNAGTRILVFNFSEFNQPEGGFIIFTNSTGDNPAVAFLSQGNMTIAGTIWARGTDAYYQYVPMGPMGNCCYYGGRGGPGQTYLGQGGNVETAGLADFGDGGGGHGGPGAPGINANGSQGGRGGASYNPDLSARLLGGSPGAAGQSGGGGGAIQLGSLGTVSITGSVNVNGGAGTVYYDRNFSNFSRAGGGGSGGAILIHGLEVNISGSLEARGGAGASGPGRGGGGSGGRIFIGWKTTARLQGTIAVDGAGGAGSGSFVADRDVSIPSLPVAVLSNPSLLGPSHFKFLLTGIESRFAIDVSTNLTSWQELRTGMATNGIWEITEEMPATNVMRYYRARMLE